MKITTIFSCFLLLLSSGCIGDDIVFDTVEESVSISNPIDSIGLGMTYQLEVRFLNNVGQAEERSASWTSSDDHILTVDDTGLATGIAVGTATITSTIELDGKDPISDKIAITVTEEEIIVQTNDMERTGTLRTTSTYKFEGSFVLKMVDDELQLQVKEDFDVSSALPGLYLYLTNNPNTNNGALEVSAVTQFSGAQTFVLPSDVGLNDYQYVLGYCKPFSVKVGDG